MPLWYVIPMDALERLQSPPVNGVLSAQVMPPIQKVATIRPVNQSRAGVGGLLYDMGVNMAGVARLQLHVGVPAGTAVTLQFGEVVMSPPDAILLSP